MTERQIKLIEEAKALNERIRLLNLEINALQLQYIEVTNKLFDSINDKDKLKNKK